MKTEKLIEAISNFKYVVGWNQGDSKVGVLVSRKNVTWVADGGLKPATKDKLTKAFRGNFSDNEPYTASKYEAAIKNAVSAKNIQVEKR